MDIIPPIPRELFDAFLDELGSNDSESASRSALANCSLVCRSFHSIVAGHLFSNIIVNKASTEPDACVRTAQRLKDLAHIFAANDTIAPRVRSFTIDTMFGPFTPPGGRHLILSNMHLPVILDALSALRHFAWCNHRLSFPWHGLSLRTLTALRAVFARPSLTSLSLECIADLEPTDIARCTNLTHLRLVHVDPPIDADLIHESEPSPTTPLAGANAGMRLRSLTEFNAVPMATAALSEAALADLRELRVWMRNDEQVAGAWVLMQRAARTLEVLDVPELSHFRYPDLIPGPVDLGALPRLHTVSVGCRIATLDRVVVPLGICGLFRTPHAPTRIADIAITLDWVNCAVGSEDARFVMEPGWAALDDALARPEIYPALRSVTFALRMGYGWVAGPDGAPPAGVERIRDRVARLAAGLLPRVAAAGVGRVQVDLMLYNSIYASEPSYI